MKGEISEGHARALLRDGITLEQQVMLFDEIKRNRLSVRQIEELVRRLIAGIPAARKSAEKTVDADLRSSPSPICATRWGPKSRCSAAARAGGS